MTFSLQHEARQKHFSLSNTCGNLNLPALCFLSSARSKFTTGNNPEPAFIPRKRCPWCKRDERLLEEQAVSSSKAKKLFPVTLVLTGNISIVPGGPGKPSAPGRPGRPGGPYKNREEVKSSSYSITKSSQNGLRMDETSETTYSSLLRPPAPTS